MAFAALLGDPVAPSISHVVHNAMAEALCVDYQYIKIHVRNQDDLPQCLSSLQQLGCIGANITMPYKAVARHLVDDLDASARKIGAVNTIVFKDQRLIGFNTDGVGAIRALEALLRPVVDYDKVVIIGAGGAARAIVGQLIRRRAQVRIFTPRLQDEGAAFLADVDPMGVHDLKVLALDASVVAMHLCEAHFLINATPAGMWPDADAMPFPVTALASALQRRSGTPLLVFDAVYRPSMTRLLRQSSDGGAKVCSGLWMLIYQAVEAFRLFTGAATEKIDVQAIYDIIRCQVDAEARPTPMTAKVVEPEAVERSLNRL